MKAAEAGFSPVEAQVSEGGMHKPADTALMRC
jgi:hypothetical protein